MDHECDIHRLLPGDDDTCPVCTSVRERPDVRDVWQELRAIAAVPEPEPLVLDIAG